MGTKKIITNQNYNDNYWKLTLEVSDIFGDQFNTCLRMIINKIDYLKGIGQEMDSVQYQKLQKEIGSIYAKSDPASTRKCINQFLKLGFVNNEMKSYHELTPKFLNETDQNKKKLLFSRIVYDNASFNRSFTNITSENEINFLIKTLEEVGVIAKKQMIGLISTKPSNYPKGYLTQQELHDVYAKALAEDLNERKYNQANYIFGLCKHLTDVYWNKDFISFTEMPEEEKENSGGRDPYLQRLYKQELKDDVERCYNEIICCLLKMPFPILIASHIKPYRDCDPTEEFDRNNGLLLCRDFDSYFDSGKVSFDDDGNILFGPDVDPRIIEHFKNFKLDEGYFNEKRREYMKYHRKLNGFSDD